MALSTSTKCIWPTPKKVNSYLKSKHSSREFAGTDHVDKTSLIRENCPTSKQASGIDMTPVRDINSLTTDDILKRIRESKQKSMKKNVFFSNDLDFIKIANFFKTNQGHRLFSNREFNFFHNFLKIVIELTVEFISGHELNSISQILLLYLIFFYLLVSQYPFTALLAELRNNIYCIFVIFFLF